ncbi:MAG: apolipoprotein N-acyltransferase [Alphaproteobacteria bacterium]|nr:apolipoprotein N-acyltransferase [Alphaproteobacteria bacterium]
MSRFASWPQGLGRLTGWRRIVVALALGAAAGFSMPPWYVLPLMPIGLVGLVWLLDSGLGDAPRRRRNFFDGFLWGLGHFSVGCYWITEAFFVPPAIFAPLGPPIVIGLAALLSLFVGTACVLYVATIRAMPGRFAGWRRVPLFALWWVVAEWGRGHVMTGFPWNPAGHVWAFSAPALQPAAWVGVYGLSLLTILILAMPATLADAVPRRWLPSVVAAVLALAIGVTGGLSLEARLAEANARTTPVEARPMLRLVQPNIPQGEKWKPELRAEHAARFARLSTVGRPPEVAHVIWPETATSFLLAQSPSYLQALRALIPKGGYLLLGAPRGPMTAEEERRPSALADSVPIWNSLHVVDDQGVIRATYDKNHLVPLGEYLPLRNIIPLSDTIGRGSFEFGEKRQTIALPGLPPFAVAICYEAIFPDEIVAKPRPAWILNVTNDSWFGTSSGPYQHMISARLRAVEEGLPVIRVANTGITAVIDGGGRVLRQLAMNVEGVIDERLPPALSPTPYGQYGDVALLALMVMVALIISVHQPRHP